METQIDLSNFKTVKFRSPFDGEEYRFNNQKDWYGHQWNNFNIGDDILDINGNCIGYLAQKTPFSILIVQHN